MIESQEMAVAETANVALEDWGEFGQQTETVRLIKCRTDSSKNILVWQVLSQQGVEHLFWILQYFISTLNNNGINWQFPTPSIHVLEWTRTWYDWWRRQQALTYDELEFRSSSNDDILHSWTFLISVALILIALIKACCLATVRSDSSSNQTLSPSSVWCHVKPKLYDTDTYIVILKWYAACVEVFCYVGYCNPRTSFRHDVGLNV